MRRIKHLVVLLAALAAAAPLNAAWSDELSDAFLDVMKNPASAEANLRYARLAEEKGKPRLALATYERILLNDPNNEEARKGMQRLRRELQPSNTQFRAEIGTSWETNPANMSSGGKNEPGVFGSIAVRDERSVGAYAWRTTGILAADFVHQMSSIDYTYLGAGTGPVIDVTPGLSVYPALGVGEAELQHRIYYREAMLSSTFEGRFSGAYETFRLRGGVRHYGSYFTSDKGYYADANAQFAVPDILGGNDLVVLSPWLRWSDINGAVTALNTDEIQPGRYREFGSSVDYYRSALSDLILGAGVKAHERHYSSTLATGEKRQDNYLAPTVSATLKDALLFQSDIKLQYTYELNRSNEDIGDYHDHIVELSFIYQF